MSRIERSGDEVEDAEFALVVTPGASRVGRRLPRSASHAYEGGDAKGSGRAAIKEFSMKSRRMMLWRLASVDWETELQPPLGMLTLTYPANFPLDGRLIHAQLRRFYSRWLRHYGEAPRGAWALEFQRRGAPHFHIYASLPEEWREVEQWARVAWFEVVGSGDPRHRAWGVDVAACEFGSAADNASRIAEYFYKHNAKGRSHYQKEVPTEFLNVGRFWGLWGVRPREHGLRLTRREYVQVRRLLRSLYKARTGRRFGRRRGLDGGWSLVDWPEQTVLRYLAHLRGQAC